MTRDDRPATTGAGGPGYATPLALLWLLGTVTLAWWAFWISPPPMFIGAPVPDPHEVAQQRWLLRAAAATATLLPLLALLASARRHRRGPALVWSVALLVGIAVGVALLGAAAG